MNRYRTDQPIPVEALLDRGFRPRTLANWRSHGVGELLPLQSHCVQTTHLLSGGNVTVFSPTSSGKTFVGELAAARHLEEGRKSVFLVPTRALAEEQYLHLRGVYGGLGARVVMATRERTQDDERIRLGQFDLAVMVYEKFRAFLAVQPQLLSRISLVVVDELQILGEPDRGELVDVLLARLVAAEPPVQVVALSAVLSENARLATWLQSEMVLWRERPCELREGVLCLEDGVFRFREANAGGEGEESLWRVAGEPDADAAPPEGWAVLPDAAQFHYPAVEQLISRFVARGEPSIVFVPTRALSRDWAYRLGQALPPAPPTDIAQRVEQSEPSANRELLLGCLHGGVAFHNSDLSADLRSAIEQACQRGEVRVLVATATLSQGVNLRCRNVIQVPLMLGPAPVRARVRVGEGAAAFNAEQKISAAPGEPAPMLRPLSRQRYRNQGGRAGRLQSGQPWGRSILIAETRDEADALFRQYVCGEVEPLPPGIQPQSLDRLVLDLVHSGRASDEDTLSTLLLETYSAAIAWGAVPVHLQQQIRQAVDRLVVCSLLQRQPGARVACTGVGQVGATFGLRRETLVLFTRCCEYWKARGALPGDRDLLVAAAFTQDGQRFPLRVSAREVTMQLYPRMAAGGENGGLPPVLKELVLPDAGFSTACHSGLKKTLLAEMWLGSLPTGEVEKRFQVFAGTISALAAHVGWLLQGLAACARTLQCADGLVQRAEQLALRLPLGVPAGAEDLALVSVPGLSRSTVQVLAREGFNGLAALSDAEPGDLEGLVGVDLAGELVRSAREVREARQARESAQNCWSWPAVEGGGVVEGPGLEIPVCRESEVQASPPGEPAAAPAAPISSPGPSTLFHPTAVLALDPSHPGRIVFRGHALQVRPKCFDLVRLLASKPGRTVSHSEIEKALWPGAQVERRQSSAHKMELVKALARVCPREEAERIIVTDRPYGLRLNLPEHAVRLQF